MARSQKGQTMIDWHSHILPGMDDGSRDTEESLALLKMQNQQGVDTVIATPHFYANDESISSFLLRRTEAFDRLKSHLELGGPVVRLGAEVYYYPGISRMEDLKALRIEGTKILLLEMPMSVWTDFMIKEIIDLSTKSEFVVMLAHVDRYLTLQDKSIWERLHQNGVQMQMNANAFLAVFGRSKPLSCVKKGLVRFIGSDCHNTTRRPPNIGRAFCVLQKHFGHPFISQFLAYGDSMLSED